MSMSVSSITFESKAPQQTIELDANGTEIFTKKTNRVTHKTWVKPHFTEQTACAEIGAYSFIE